MRAWRAVITLPLNFRLNYSVRKCVCAQAEWTFYIKDAFAKCIIFSLALSINFTLRQVTCHSATQPQSQHVNLKSKQVQTRLFSQVITIIKRTCSLCESSPAEKVKYALNELTKHSANGNLIVQSKSVIKRSGDFWKGDPSKIVITIGSLSPRAHKQHGNECKLCVWLMVSLWIFSRVLSDTKHVKSEAKGGSSTL